MVAISSLYAPLTGLPGGFLSVEYGAIQPVWRADHHTVH